MDQNGTWRGGGPRSRPHCARWGPSCPPQIGDRGPNFRPISIVAKRLDDQDALGTEVGLGQGDIVLDGEPAPPQKMEPHPNFPPISIVAKRL